MIIKDLTALPTRFKINGGWVELLFAGDGTVHWKSVVDSAGAVVTPETSKYNDK